MSRVQDELAWCGAIAPVISASQAAPVMTNSPPKQTAKYTASRQHIDSQKESKNVKWVSA
jgi:hypothetical protein